MSLAHTWFIAETSDLVHDQYLTRAISVSARMVIIIIIIAFSIPEIQASDYNYVVANI